MSAASPGPDGERVVICGAGIIGASTAYHLTLRGVKPIVVERKEVAAAASGKAGGFLARGWGDGSVTQALHRVSFDMHEQLAQELGVESYRKIPTMSVAGGAPRGRNLQGAMSPSWLDGAVARSEVMDLNTAQVTPLELTSKLMAAAVANGATLTTGTVRGVVTEEGEGGERVAGVQVDDDVIAADKVVVAMGPWSTLASEWFDIPVPMEGVKSTSVVYKAREAVAKEPAALFCAEDNNGCHLEVYPRPNGDVYICGIGGSDYVGAARLAEGGDCGSPELIKEDPARVAAAAASFGAMTSVGDGGPDQVQACMRPCPPDALPILGEVPGLEGAFLACGHNCWGILWAPVTGLAMSELLVDGASKCVDIAPFSPARFMRSARRGTRGRKQGDKDVGEQW